MTSLGTKSPGLGRLVVPVTGYMSINVLHIVPSCQSIAAKSCIHAPLAIKAFQIVKHCGAGDHDVWTTVDGRGWKWKGTGQRSPQH